MPKRPPRLDPDEIARKKQASRDEDARALAAGEKTREELRRENSLFAPFEGRIKILFDKAKRLR